MPPNLVQKKTFRRRLPFFAASAAALFLALSAWFYHDTAQGARFRSQRENIDGRLARMEDRRAALKRETEALLRIEEDLQAYRTLIARRTDLARRLVALRDSVPDGMWLATVESLKDGSGGVTRLRVTGRGFKDRLKALEQAGGSQAGGSQATAVEIFRDRLKAQPLFTDEVKILTEGDDPRFPDQVRQFTVEVGLEPSAGATPTEESPI
jgi:hypothetical protein